MKQISKVEIDNPKPNEYGRIGELVYLVDPFIYPALFGSPEFARIAMPVLMSIENSPFAPKLVNTARIDGDIVGILVLYAEPFERLPNLTEFLESDLHLPKSSFDVCENYLLPMCAHISFDEAYIPCIATDPAHRGKGVASSLIRHAQELTAGRRLALDVLRDNENAIRLYEKHGFTQCGVTKGYAYMDEPPEVIAMKTLG